MSYFIAMNIAYLSHMLLMVADHYRGDRNSLLAKSSLPLSVVAAITALYSCLSIWF